MYIILEKWRVGESLGGIGFGDKFWIQQKVWSTNENINKLHLIKIKLLLYKRLC